MILRQRKKDGFLLTWEDNLLGEIMENGGFLNLNSEDEAEERIRKLHQAMGNLSPGQQQCILLFYFDDKSYLEIEQTTGYTLNEVKSHIQNGKRNLKIALEQHLY